MNPTRTKVTETSPEGIVTRVSDGAVIGHKCNYCSTADIIPANELESMSREEVVDYIYMSMGVHESCKLM